MTGYVVAGYLVTFVSIALYALRTIRRSRALSQYLNWRDTK